MTEQVNCHSGYLLSTLSLPKAIHNVALQYAYAMHAFCRIVQLPCGMVEYLKTVQMFGLCSPA